MGPRASRTPLKERLFQVLEMFGEVGGELVGSGVGIPDRPGYGAVFLEELQVVADGSIVESEGGRELMRVRWRTLKALKDTDSIGAASGTDEQIPHQRTEARVQHLPGPRGAPLINPTATLTRAASAPR
jgi:hypothetical protein